MRKSMNLALLADSYKYSHTNQYPKNTKAIYNYFESRGSDKFQEIVFFGLQYYLMEYLNAPTQLQVMEAEKIAQAHGVPFDVKGWSYIAELGHIPVKIVAVPEGSVCGTFQPLFTVESTDSNVPWIAGFIETLLMKVWYPITVASKSYHVRKIIEGWYRGSNIDVNKSRFAYHNFGDRGSSSVESAAIGGAAHLTQFFGTDNFNALDFVQKYYGHTDSPGYSIPASEHSTVTSWGVNAEFDFYDNYLENYKGSKMIACVLDSYDVYRAVRYVTTGKFKEKVESADYPIFVIRPDSGEPLHVISQILKIMEDNGVKSTTDKYGNKLFDKYRIIWGDGITPEVISRIYADTKFKGYSPENFAFGSGGDLMQNLTRDTCKFAIKCSAIKLTRDNGDGPFDVIEDVYKQPITDMGKQSKRGIQTIPTGRVVFNNGVILKTTFEEVRANAGI